MNTRIASIRLKNLKKILQEISITELSQKLGYKQPSYLYQIVNQTAIQNGKPKNIGTNLARRIEKVLDIEEGWLDQNQHNLPLINADCEQYTFLLNISNKKQAFEVIEQYGMTPEQVFNLLLREIATTQSIPLRFDYLRKQDE